MTNEEQVQEFYEEPKTDLESLVNKGLSFQRLYTDGITPPKDMFSYDKKSVKIVDRHTGNVIFERDNIEVPSEWGQSGTDIMASEYLRKTGVPGTGAEISLKQLVHRVTHTIRAFGEEKSYF